MVYMVDFRLVTPRNKRNFTALYQIGFDRSVEEGTTRIDNGIGNLWAYPLTYQGKGGYHITGDKWDLFPL